MAKDINAEIEDRIEEIVFQSLVFPMKRKWTTEKTGVRARKSATKRKTAAFNAGKIAPGTVDTTRR